MRERLEPHVECAFELEVCSLSDLGGRLVATAAKHAEEFFAKFVDVAPEVGGMKVILTVTLTVDLDENSDPLPAGIKVRVLEKN